MGKWGGGADLFSRVGQFSEDCCQLYIRAMPNSGTRLIFVARGSEHAGQMRGWGCNWVRGEYVTQRYTASATAFYCVAPNMPNMLVGMTGAGRIKDPGEGVPAGSLQQSYCCTAVWVSYTASTSVFYSVVNSSLATPAFLNRGYITQQLTHNAGRWREGGSEEGTRARRGHPNTTHTPGAKATARTRKQPREAPPPQGHAWTQPSTWMVAYGATNRLPGCACLRERATKK